MSILDRYYAALDQRAGEERAKAAQAKSRGDEREHSIHLMQSSMLGDMLRTLGRVQHEGARPGALQAQIDSLISSSGSNADLQNALAAKEAELLQIKGEAAAKIADLENQVAELNAQVDSLISSSQNVTELQNALSEKEAELLQIRGEAGAKIADLEAQIGSLNAQLDSMNGSAAAEIEAMQNTLLLKDAEILQLKTDFETFSLWFVELHKVLDEIRKEETIEGISIYVDPETEETIDPIAPPLENILPPETEDPLIP